MNIRTESSGIAGIEIVTLFDVDATAQGLSSILRFTPSSDPGGSLVPPDGAKILWKGNEYTPYPVDATGFEKAAQGSLPRPQFTFSNITGQLGALVASAKFGMLGAIVTRTRTLRKYLDDQPTANPNAALPLDIWVVARKVSETGVQMVFECATAFDLEGVQLPNRQVVAGLCLYVYRGSECTYAGPPVQDINGNPTSNPALDQCAKTLNACSARFGAKGPLLTSAFPASLLISQTAG
jgi:lambda family phage minor tail protein L